MPIVCFGELLVDLVSESPDDSFCAAPRFLKSPGGAPANVAVGLNRLGSPSRFVGQVGDDPFGHWLHDVLSEEGVDVRFLRHCPHARTTLALVATRRDGNKDVCFYRHPGADSEFAAPHLDSAMFEGATMFHCGGVSLSKNPCREAQMEAVRQAKERGLVVSFDPNWRPSLWDDVEEARRILWEMLALCDIVKVAAEEWEFFSGAPLTCLDEGAAKLRSMGPRLIVVTLGADGAYFNTAKAQGCINGIPASVKDTLGAGDSFMAGLLHQFSDRNSLKEMSEKQLRQAIQFANACGAIATETAGAIPSFPRYTQVQKMLYTCSHM